MKRSAIDRFLIFGASFLRAIGIGMVAVLVAIYLCKAGLSTVQIGAVISVGLIGCAIGNLLVTFFADRIGRRKTLILYGLLSAAGAIAVCLAPGFYTILAAAFFGMLNARGKDRGAALVVESAILPSLEDAKNRTRSFAWYSFSQDVGLAVGSIAAGIPAFFSSYFSIPEIVSYQLSFGVYAAVMLLSAFIYLSLSSQTEVPISSIKKKLSPEGKKAITKLCTLFGLDSLAGGFLTSSLIAFYFYERFEVNIAVIGIIFFAARCLNALSYFASVWVSKRIGLVNTMVFTHLPSHLCLLAIVFAPNFPLAALFFLLRESLVEMDVPTKKSYMMALVKPEERTTAAGLTQMVRMAGWAVAPVFAGYVMQEYAMSCPLFIGAGIKITYDILVYFSFRKLKPPEELDQTLINRKTA